MAANGQMINHYRILKPIGKGGMGEVFLAEDTILERKVAIKFLPESVQQDSDMRKRFLREAKAAAGMDHPNICRVYETGEFEGRSFIVMEYVAGETLKERLIRGPIPLKEAIPLACEIAEAIQGAHECGIIHRDLKPANIMLMPQGHPKIMDFGLAKQIGSASNTAGLDSNASTVSLPPVGWNETGETQGAVTQEHAEQPDKDAAETVPPDQDYANNSNLSTISDAFPLSGQSTKSSSAVPSDLTKAGTLLGTIDYMSPEQARCERLDVRSDIFAFGVVLYEMLTGRNPFHRQSTIQTLSAILRDAPDIPQKQAEGDSIPHRLQQVLNKAMAKDSSERYQSMKEMEVDLQAAREDLLPRKRPAWVSWVLSAAAVLVVALAITIWWYATHVQPVETPIVKVLITDFDNRTNDTIWNETLEEALQVDLENAGNISSYRRSKALQTAQKLQPEVTGLNEEVARLIARSEGIDIIITGFIENPKSEYRLGVQTMDAITGEVKERYQADAKNRDTVLDEMAGLAVDIRKDLGDKEADASKLNAKETFTSSSLESVKSYVIAQNYQDENNWKDALDAYLKSIDLDPDFGRAYAGAGTAYFRLGDPAESEKYYKEAMKRTDRMTLREKYRTIGNYYLLNRNYSEAIENYNDLVEQYPADGVGYNQLAYAYLCAGDTKKSLYYGQKSFDMDPSNVTKHSNLALFAMYAGDFETAATRSAEVIELNPANPFAYICQAIVQIINNKDPLRGRQFYGMLEEVDDRGASLALIGFADLAMYEGRLQEAISLLEKFIAENQAKDVSYYAAIKQTALAGAYLQLNQQDRSISVADKAIAARNDNRFLYEAAMIYLQAGRSAQALELAEVLKSKLEPEPQTYAHIIEASEMSKRDVAGAVRLMQDTLDEDVDCWLARFELGKIYLENEKPFEALFQFDQCLTRLGEATAVFLDDIPTLRYIPLIYYYLGRAYAGAGNTSAASDYYNKFLEIKAGTDEDPLVAEVRERLAALE